MKFTPLPQQRKMIDHMLSHEEALVFSEMGLGKSAAVLETIATLLGDHEIKGALIIAPLRVCALTWPAELAKYDRFSWMSLADLRTFEGKTAWKNGLADVYVLNYDMLIPFATQDWGLKGKREIPVDCIVYDEISKARNPSSKRIKALAPFRHFFKRHIGLTGTPSPNSLLDLFGPVRLIDAGKRLGPSFHAFRQRYFESDFQGWKWTLRDWAKEKIEERIADITITQRREDWLHLPPTSVEDVDVALPLPLRKQYLAFQKQLLTEIKGKEIVALNAASLVQKLLQFTSGAIYDEDRGVNHLHDHKIDALRDLMKNLKAPVLVASAFIHERARIVEKIEGAEEFREDRLDAWNRGEISCWVADPRSVSFGLNLQKGSCNVVWFSLTYSREQYDQMCARLIRQGQEKPTTIWRLVCSHTVDEAIIEALRVKGEGQDALMSTLKNLEALSKIAKRP